VILVDTSVWIDHLRSGVPALVNVLEAGSVMTHAHVVGELACGNLKNRNEVLQLLQELAQAPVATDAEVLAFIEHHRLMGRGIGYIDAHLLAATTLAGDAKLWSRDRRLARVALELGLGLEKEPPSRA